LSPHPYTRFLKTPFSFIRNTIIDENDEQAAMIGQPNDGYCGRSAGGGHIPKLSTTKVIRRTFVGAVREIKSPWPSCPNWFPPQEKTSERDVIAIVCVEPHATETSGNMFSENFLIKFG
jgi:hypothetical protein